MKFIHLTDPHLTAAGDLFEIDVDARLRAAVTSINTHHADATLVMITGDIAHWGEVGAYTRARAILGDLVMPWYPLIGNHDVREAYLSGLPEAPRNDDGQACFRIDTDAGTFLALDTQVEGTHAGCIDDKQLVWLKGEFAATTGDVFLFMHHPPMPSGIAALDRIKLQNPDDLSTILDARPGRLRHLFFGHMHRAFHGSWRGIPFSTVKSTAHQVVAELNDDGPLISSREMPAYAVVLVTTESVAVHDVSFLEEDKAFSYQRDRGRPEM